MIKWDVRITKWHREAGMVFLCSLFLLFSLVPTLKAEDPYEPNDSFETATPIEESEIEADIDPAGDLDYFKFDGIAGRPITIDIDAQSLDPFSLLDSVICLYDESETELVCNDDYDGSDSLILNFILPTDGIYYIKVEDYNGRGDERYFYVLRLSGTTDVYEPNDDFDTATPIELGDVISALIAPAGDLDYFQFNGTAGQPVTINIDAQSLDPPSLLDSVICLYDEGEVELVCNNDYDGSDSLILNFILPTDGIYYIKVEDYNDAGGVDYFYDLRLSGVTDVYEPNDGFDIATPINLGDVISATIDPRRDLDYFQFNGIKDQPITIDIDTPYPSRLYYSVLRLYDADRRVIASCYYYHGPGYDPQILHTLPRDGIYYIRVEGGYDDGGEYYFYNLRLTGDIHDIIVSNRTDDSVTISWWTHGKIPVTGIVNYGITTAFGSTATDDNLRENGIHYVDITGLTANTQYFFEVVSGEDTDDNDGQYYTFITAKVPQDPPEPYNVLGYVYEDTRRTTPAPHVIKYFWLKNVGGEESSLLSALTNAKGYWLGDLGKAKTKSDETNDIFPFAAGDTIYAYPHIGKWSIGHPGYSTSRYIVSGVSPQQLGDEWALAVELASFTAVAKVDGVVLNWRTISEINNLGFNVYRSTEKDGKYALVNAELIGGAGTDATPHDYSFTDENVKVGQTYYYYIEDIDFTGKTSKSDIIEVTIGKQVIKKQFVPPTFALLQNYPNPFNPETWIPFKLAENASVVIHIYSAKGQLVRTIVLGNQKAGAYVTKDKAAYWDGKDSLGEKVASGVYFYTIQAGEFRAGRKMVILK